MPPRADPPGNRHDAFIGSGGGQVTLVVYLPAALIPYTRNRSTHARRPRGVDVFGGDNGGRPIDWAKVSGAGYGFAFLKASEGEHTTDKQFAHNWTATRSAGVVRGAYHYLDGDSNGAAQAQHFCAVLAANGGLLADDVPPILDLESLGNESAKDLAATAHAFLDAAEATLQRPFMIDTGIYFAGNDGTFGDMPLWVPRYGDIEDPGVPHGWTDWAFWQTSETGEVRGIDGPCDGTSFHRETPADRQAWVAGH